MQRIDGYLRPTTLAPALAFLAETEATVVAGGTDHYPTYAHGATGTAVLDVTALHELRGIERTGDEWRFGAATTWTDIRDADLPPAFFGLKQAAAMVGGVQIQNRASLGGNLCNASPAADGVPPLLTLDAEVELESAVGTRRMPLASFITGSRSTMRRADELLTSVVVPEPSGRAIGSFEKLGSRCYLVISIVMAAALVESDRSETITGARVAVGACSPVALRLPAVERALVGRSIDTPLNEAAAAQVTAALSPIDDIRGAADYRRQVAPTLVDRAIRRCTTEVDR